MAPGVTDPKFPFGHPSLNCSPDGPLPFRPAPRQRSEASFSQVGLGVHYGHENLPAAGVASGRAHKQSQPKQDKKGTQKSDPLMLCMDEAEAGGHRVHVLGGRRVNPACLQNAAGAPAHATSHIIEINQANQAKEKVNIPAKYAAVLGIKKENNAKALAMESVAKSMTIDMISKKKRPQKQEEKRRNIIQNIGTEEVKEKPQRRIGYKHNLMTTQANWNNPQNATNSTEPPRDRSDGRANSSKILSSCYGEPVYNICGAEDMSKAATKEYVKSEVPPSERLLKENNRSMLRRFEFEAPTSRCQRLMESTGMWGCLNHSLRRTWEPPEQKMSLPPGTPGWMLSLRHDAGAEMAEVSDSGRSFGGDYAEYLEYTKSPNQNYSNPDYLRSPTSSELGSPQRLRPVPESPGGQDMRLDYAEQESSRPRMEKSASVPSGKPNGAGGALLSRASSTAGASHPSGRQSVGTPARRRSSENGSVKGTWPAGSPMSARMSGSDSPAKPSWRI